MDDYQKQKFDAICDVIDEYLNYHSVITGIDRYIIDEYTTIVSERAGKSFDKISLEELAQFKYGRLVANERTNQDSAALFGQY